MKYLNFLRLMPVALALTVLITACSTQDVYEPDPVIPEKPEEPVVPSVDIDWLTYTKTKLSVDVNDQYNGLFYYTVEAYMNNPVIDENAKLIAGSGQKTNKNVPYDREIVVPAGETAIYVAITDPFGRRRVYIREVQEGTISLILGENNIPVTKSSGASVYNATAMPTIDYTYGNDCIALEGTAAVTLEKNTAYIVKKGTTFSGKLTFDGQGYTKVYVEGTLLWDNSTSLQKGTAIYVLDGGVLKSKSTTSKIEMVGGSPDPGAMIAIQEGGVFGDINNLGAIALIDMTNEATIVNEGELYVAEIDKTSKAQLYNSGTIYMTKLVTHDLTNPVLNHGTILAKDITLTNGSIENHNLVEVTNRLYMNGGLITNTHTVKALLIECAQGTIENSCLIETAKFQVNGTTLEQAVGAYFEATVGDLKGVTFNFDDSSIFDSETISFTGSTSIVKGVGAGYALLRASKSITLGYAGVATYDGQLEIDYNNRNGGTHSKITNVKGNATFADGQASVEIQPSDCNKYTGNNNPGEGDGDTDNVYQEGETLPYTYMFEDNWPARGDYDMNDLVIAVELRNTTSGAKTQSTQVVATLYAVGATKVLGAGFQLDGIRASSVNGGEAGQDYAVFRLFNDAHATLGGPAGSQLNTYKVDYAAKVIETEVVYSTPIDGMINASNFNLFLVLNGDFDQAKRSEVHLPGFKGTSKAVTSELCTADYIDVETGWMWGLAIPQTEFATYPKESDPIYDAYQGFDTWVAGSDTPDWYDYPIVENVITFE